MSEFNHNFVPTVEQKALDIQARERAAREDTFQPTQRDERVSMEKVVELGEALKPAVDVFRRMADRAKAFFDGVRDEIERANVLPATCDQHPDVRRAVDFDRTASATRAQGSLAVVYDDCPECARDERETTRRRYWARAGVPARVIDATFSNFNSTGAEEGAKRSALGLVKKWHARGTGFLLLVGTPGTGKGHLAAACLMRHGSGLWVEHPRLMSELRASYTAHNTETVLAAWQDAELFVLDELGLSSGGADEEPALYQVLADRYEKRRPTIITTNVSIEHMKRLLGERLLDRIREDLTQVPMCWPSYRTTKPEIL